MPRAKWFADAAAEMIAAAGGRHPVAPILRRRCPDVYRQIVADARHPGMFRLWGRSANFDDNAQAVIVDPTIVRAIGEAAGIAVGGRFVHAGLLHTYGYLFSLIDTPYGAKRDRWILEHLENGFGLSSNLLSDAPTEGTLLANVSWFFGQIAFRGSPARFGRRGRAVPHAAGELLRYDFAKLRIRRIVEEAQVPGGNRTIRIVTDLVSYRRPPAAETAENTLLVYSLQGGATAPLRLITGFPMRQVAVDELCKTVPRSGSAEIRLRYNAYLPGLFGRTVRGRRYFADDE
jgi:hypothetical protein